MVESISNIVSAAGLFLATLSILYALWYPKTIATIDQSQADIIFFNSNGGIEQVALVESYYRFSTREEALKIAFDQLLVLAIGAAVLFLIFMPPAIGVLAITWECAPELTRCSYSPVSTTLIALVVGAALMSIHTTQLALSTKTFRRLIKDLIAEIEKAINDGKHPKNFIDWQGQPLVRLQSKDDT